MDGYLLEKQVQCTIITPLRIGIGGQLPPHLISVGVNHRTLPAELGIEVAVHCRSIFLQSNIDDMHVNNLWIEVHPLCDTSYQC